MLNQSLAKILSEMSILLEMDEIPFKPRAYEKAAYSISGLTQDIEVLYREKGLKALEEIPGVGVGIAERIEEFIKTGKIRDYEKLKKKMPVNIAELNNIEGVGPKIIKILYQKLKIKNAADLEKARRAGKLKNLPRFGEKLEAKILKSLEFQKKSGGRFLLGDALPLAKNIIEKLSKVAGVKKIDFCGSLRRKKETIGDIDILIVSEKPSLAMEAFVNLKEMEHIYAKGKTKTMVRLDSGIDADLRVVDEKSFGSALQYFTGSKSHNIALRKIALAKGYKLNEYGLFRHQTSDIRHRKTDCIKIAGENEEEIYNKLGLKWMPPELRENQGEIEAAQLRSPQAAQLRSPQAAQLRSPQAAAKNKLPKLIELKDIKGDLQLQTNWTDGANSIEEMAEEAKKLGYEYIAITDHTRSLAMTGGSDEKKLLAQIQKIKKINSKLQISNSLPSEDLPQGDNFQLPTSNFQLLSGAEVNINKDGSLDISDDVLEKLDFAGAAIHSHFRLNKTEQTNRLLKTMENPHIDIIFHPTGRIINKREPIELDFEKIFKAAAKTKTALEINALPDRLDLKDEHIRLAKKAGVKFMLNTDAHSTEQMRLMEYGVSQARRGWLEKKDILNALSLAEFLEFLKKPKSKRW